jgi:cell division protein FtsB
MERKKITVYAAVLFAVLVVVFLPGYSEVQKLREENDQLQRRIKLLEKHNGVLKDELSKMEEDRGYVEKKAREKLGIIEKGEVVYKKGK